MARANIEAGKQGKPYAYVFPPDQWDAGTATDMLRRLRLGGIEVQRATEQLSEPAAKRTPPAVTSCPRVSRFAAT